MAARTCPSCHRAGDEPPVQRAVDRRFNRSRYDADAAVAAFAARLKDAVDLDTARAELAEAVHRSLEPAHVSVWIRQPE